LLVPNAALRFKPADAVGKKEGDPGKPAAGNASQGNGGAGPGKGKKRDSQSGTVYVLANGEIKPVAVQVGITDNRNTEIIGGELKEGDRIVTGENGSADKKPSSVGMRMF
jgi:HlyD family secretion protein